MQADSDPQAVVYQPPLQVTHLSHVTLVTFAVDAASCLRVLPVGMAQLTAGGDRGFRARTDGGGRDDDHI